jgi:hypothetical protein
MEATLRRQDEAKMEAGSIVRPQFGLTLAFAPQHGAQSPE